MATRYINSKDFWLRCMEEMYSTTTPPLINPANGKPNKSHPSYATYNAMSKMKTFNIANGYGTIFGTTTPVRTGFDSFNTYNSRPDAHAHMTVFRGPYATTLLTELGITTMADFNALVADLNSGNASTRVDSLFAAITTSTNPYFATTTQKDTARLALFSILSEVDAASTAIEDRHNKIETMRAEAVAHGQTATDMRTWFGSVSSTLPLNTQTDLADIIAATRAVESGINANVATAEGSAFADDATFDPIINGNRTTLDNTIYPNMYRTYAEVKASTASPKPPLGTVTEKLAKFYFQQMHLPEAQRTWQGLYNVMDARGQAAFTDAQTFIDERMPYYTALLNRTQGLANFPALVETYVGAANFPKFNGSAEFNAFAARYSADLTAFMGEVMDMDKFDFATITAKIEEMDRNLFRTQAEASAINAALPLGATPVGMGEGTALVTSLIFSQRTALHTQEDQTAFRTQLIEQLKTTFPGVDPARFEAVVQEAQAFVDGTSYDITKFRLNSLHNELEFTPVQTAAVMAQPTYSLMAQKAEDKFPGDLSASSPLSEAEKAKIRFLRSVYMKETLKFNTDEASQAALIVINNDIGQSIDDLNATGAVIDIHQLNEMAVTQTIQDVAFDRAIADKNIRNEIEAKKIADPTGTAGKTDDEIKAQIIADKRASDPAFASYSDQQIMEEMVGKDPTRVATLRAEVIAEKRASDPALATEPDTVIEDLIYAEEAQNHIKQYNINGQTMSAYGDYGMAELDNRLEAQKNREFNDIDRKYFGFTPCGSPAIAGHYMAEAKRFEAMCKPGGLADYFLARDAWRTKWRIQDAQVQGGTSQGGNGGVHVEVNPVFNVTGGTSTVTTTVTTSGGGSGGGGGKGGKKDPYITIKNKIKMLYIVQDAATVAIRDGGGSVKADILKQNYMERAEEVLDLAKSMGLSDAELQEICEDAHKKYCSHQVSKVKTAGGKEVKLDGVPKYQTDPTSDMIMLKMDPSTGEPVMTQGVIEMTLDASGDPTMSFDPTKTTLLEDATICQDAMMTQDDFIDGIVPDADKPAFEANAQAELNKKAQVIAKDATEIAEEGQTAV